MPRLALSQSIFLTLLAFVAAVVLGMGGLMVWSLNNGFGAYMQARDQARLEQFATYLAKALPQMGGVEAIKLRPDLYGRLMEERPILDPELEGVQDGPPAGPGGVGRHRHRPPPHPAYDPGQPDRRGADDFGPMGPQPRLAPPPRDEFARRLVLMDASGLRVVGPRTVPGTPRLERAVVVRGVVIARLGLISDPGLREKLGGDFLNQQYLRIVGIGLILIILALGVAWWTAARWAGPLIAVREATARFARGDFSARIPVAGDREVADLIADVNLMALELQRLEAGRRRWLAEISHELRTPLTVLTGELDALSEGVRPLNLGALGSMQEELAQLRRLVDDLHLLSVADLNALSWQAEPVNGADLVRRIVARLEGRLVQAGLQVDVRLPAGGLAANWDPRRIDQLLANLLENSRRYTTAPGQVLVTVEALGDRARITVDDTAPGVAPLHLSRLAEPLYRVDTARSRSDGGSGLGLAVCAAIVESQGGTLAFAASPLGGLRVIVDLPTGSQAA